MHVDELVLVLTADKIWFQNSIFKRSQGRSSQSFLRIMWIL